jgi:hypothetical protein
MTTDWSGPAGLDEKTTLEKEIDYVLDTLVKQPKPELALYSKKDFYLSFHKQECDGPTPADLTIECDTLAEARVKLLEHLSKFVEASVLYMPQTLIGAFKKLEGKWYCRFID